MKKMLILGNFKVKRWNISEIRGKYSKYRDESIDNKYRNIANLGKKSEISLKLEENIVNFGENRWNFELISCIFSCFLPFFSEIFVIFSHF